MPESITHKYIPRVDRGEENLFVEEYYSSTDTRIYIDDEEQTEIGYISYSVQEQLKPIYGYNSNTFDDMAIGNRIISGSIKVPIKNPNNNYSKEDIIRVFDKIVTKTNEDYNEEQLVAFENADWVDNLTVAANNAKYFSQKDQEYINKLNAIGYNVSITDPQDTIYAALSQFCADYGNGTRFTGTITDEIKNKIDIAYNNKISTNTIRIPKGSVLRRSSSSSSESIIRTQEDQNAVIISTTTERTDDGSGEITWDFVELENGMRGWFKDDTD